MRIAFLNPQGNFDPQDRYWTAHPDFGGQLVYVKETALALGRMGHRVDILTRQIKDPAWPGFGSTFDGYVGEPNVRILRLPCGGEGFLRKEALWPHLGREWVPAIAAFYAAEGTRPDVAAAHYGDGGLAAAIWASVYSGPPFTFTAHSLGAQKLDGLLEGGGASLAEMEAEYAFARRIAAERAAMSHAARVITSTQQEQREQYSHPAYADTIDPASTAVFAVIPPGVNLDIFSAAQPDDHDAPIAARIQRAFARDIAPDRRHLPAILCSSRLEARKNHAGLARAFAESPALRSAANLFIVIRDGDSAPEQGRFTPAEQAVLDGILAICQSASLWGMVSFLSLTSQRELAGAYRYLARRRSVFALTALYEPFGLAPLEAMAAGLPVVVTRNGGPSETVVDPNTREAYGVLVDPTDPADIAAGLLRLLRPDPAWERYQVTGMLHVRRHYTWERTAAGYLETFRCIAGQPPRAAASPIPAYFLTANSADAPGLDGLWRRDQDAGPSEEPTPHR